MKILVTGATGFIGNHVVQWLVDHGYTVIATGTSEEKAKQFSWINSVTFIPCDYYTEEKDFYELFGKPDLLIHLAWKGLPNSSRMERTAELYDAVPSGGKSPGRDAVPAIICQIRGNKDRGYRNVL